MTLKFHSRFLSAVAYARNFGAQLRIVEHVLHIAHAVGPLAEIFAGNRPAGAANSAAVTENLFQPAEAISAAAVAAGSIASDVILSPAATGLISGLIATLILVAWRLALLTLLAALLALLLAVFISSGA
jgi:hypothetical protein